MAFLTDLSVITQSKTTALVSNWSNNDVKTLRHIHEKIQAMMSSFNIILCRKMSLKVRFCQFIRFYPQFKHNIDLKTDRKWVLGPKTHIC